MIALITSCGRPDLLALTLESLMKDQMESLLITVHEDAPGAREKVMEGDWITTTFTNGVGQHKSIEQFLEFFQRVKYYVHLEDDWEFNNSYDWIAESVRIMEQDPKIIKTLAREGSPHPCAHDFGTHGYLQPWTGEDKITWHGFSWNPGVTRVDLLKQFVPFPTYEQELSERIYNAGYKVIELSVPVYKHIGDGRSTH